MSNKMSQKLESKMYPNKFSNVVTSLRVKYPKDQQKGPKLIDPPELELPQGKRRERARRQHNAVRPYRDAIQ